MADPWGDIIGQDDAVATLRRAAAAPDSSAMTHAWLITGPPGSGRSNLAFAFASSLLSPPGTIDERVHVQVTARTHPDLVVLATEGVLISIDAAREAVQRASMSPATSRHRVVVVEDADRMTERTSNTLLKALEEPPEDTVWILCAPGESDLLPTIRSRVRTVSLGVPDADAVARLLVERDGVDPALAAQVAREAQSHIGMARRLATSEEARARRAETLDVALRVQTAGHAVLAAARYVEIAGADAEALGTEQDAAERDQVLRQLGIAPGGTVPPQLRKQLRELEERQKGRARRGLRDGVDRILVDLLSLFRDILLTQLGVAHELVNAAQRARIEEAARGRRPEDTLAVLDGIQLARERIEANVPPLLSLEALLVVIASPDDRR
ncbi:DNA polymerase III subunit delta' [Agrococcus versicolor]|uniref:DNA polymerase III subunit delta n=1 Tax=Agrococcus versicolor TaxID=501482 RepID=A0ABP5MAF2_9MICO